MLIFAGVDGTGAGYFANDPDKYHPVYQNSHVSKLSRMACWDPQGMYARGPGLFGLETGGLAATAVAYTMSLWIQPGEHRVFLAGFSRGAAAVIEAARMLKQREVPVECLILFDPVDRSHIGGVGGGRILPGPDTPIVDTVRYCIKVIRHPAAASRESFDNCGKAYQSSATIRQEMVIYATHGGVGGTPWDAKCVPSGYSYIDEGVIPNNPITGLGGSDPNEMYEVDGMTRVTPAQDQAGATASWNFVNAMLSPIIDQAMLDTGAATEPTRDEGLGPNRTQIDIRCVHTVKPGESLSLIAMQYYGAFHRWTDIYQANLSTIGSNPNVIQPNMKLSIPV